MTHILGMSKLSRLSRQAPWHMYTHWLPVILRCAVAKLAFQGNHGSVLQRWYYDWPCFLPEHCMCSYTQHQHGSLLLQTRFLAFQRQLGITNPTAAYDIEPSAEDPFVSKRGSLDETSSSKSKKAGSSKAKGKGGSRSKKPPQAVLSGAGSTRLAARLPRAGMVPVRSVLAFPRRLPFRSHAPRLSYQKAQMLLC